MENTALAVSPVAAITALAVRGVSIRKPDMSFLPIGQVAELCKVVNPAKLGEGVSEDERKAVKALWKTFAKEYNDAKEASFKQNDAACAIAARELQVKGFKAVVNKAGEIVGYNAQLRQQNRLTLAQQLEAARKEIAALKAEKQKERAMLASKTEVQG